MMHIEGPVAKRTRAKEAEFFKQCYREIKKTRVEGKSVSKETESVSFGRVKKGNSSSKNSRGGSGVAKRGDIDSSNCEHLEFLETDHRYEMFLSCYYDSIQRTVGKRSVFYGSEGFMRENVSCDDDCIVGDDNDIDIAGASENNNGNVLPVTNLRENDVKLTDEDNDVSIRDDNVDENFENDNCSLQPDEMNYSESSEDGSDNMQLETRDCIIISDDEDGGCDVTGNGGASTSQTLEKDSDNLQVETKFPEEHTNVGDGDGNSDESEPSGLQRDFQVQSMTSSDIDKSSEDTSEESKLSSEEDSVEEDDEDYKEEKSASGSEELSSDFEEEKVEHLKYSKKKDNGEVKSSDYEEEEEHQFEFITKRGEKDVAKKASKTAISSSASVIELESDFEKEEEEEKMVFSKENRAENVKKDEAKTRMMREMAFRSSNSETKRSNDIDLTLNPEREESREKESGGEGDNGLSKNQRSAENVKKDEAKTRMMREMAFRSSNSETKRSNDIDLTLNPEREESREKESGGEGDNGLSKNQRSDVKGVKDVSKEKPTIRKRIRAPKTTHDVVKILADSILEHSEIPREEETQPLVKPSLPLKFTFGVEECVPPEKSEEEKELDQLWADMAIALCDTLTENNLEVDGENDNVPEVELDGEARCNRGDHFFLLDEEIGLICKLCSFVKTESKYLTVPFSENPFGRSGTRGSFKVQHNTMEDFHHHMDDNTESTHDSDFLKQGTVWDIVPGIDRGMHPHQKEGFEFLWRNIAGDIQIDKLKEDSEGGERGCVISHAPGTGKTRLTISFLQTYVKQYPLCRAVIIAPCGMLPTWEAEFQKWNVDIPFHNLNSGELSGKENISALKLASKVNSASKGKLTRMVKLYSWAKDRSILGMSYRLFAELVGAARTSKFKEDEAERNRKILFEQSGLIVLDEGHTARNENSLIWQALSKVHTKKRVILSGTPFQNNFDELYNIFWLARPKFAEDIPFKRHEQSARRGRKKVDARQIWGSITDQISRGKDDSLNAQPLAQLRKIIGPFVHIHKGNILQEKLPGLRDSVIVLEPCKLQKKLLVNAQTMYQRYYFGKEHIISLLSVHPSLLLDIGSAMEKISHDIDGLERTLRQIRLNPEVGIKTKFLMELVRLCEAVKERVLVFSQYIDPLDFIIEQLKSQFKWMERREILYIHGKLEVDKRQQLIKDFNDPKSEAKVLLASIKACSEGINLVGASRVVLLDVVWNPSVERQAISRAYRLGQEKVVHIYHLITSGTMEEEKYCRQSEKDRLSDLLFDSAEKGDEIQKMTCNISDEKADLILQHMRDHEKLKDMFKNIIYQPKDTNLIESFGFLGS